MYMLIIILSTQEVRLQNNIFSQNIQTIQRDNAKLMSIILLFYLSLHSNIIIP